MCHNEKGDMHEAANDIIDFVGELTFEQLDIKKITEIIISKLSKTQVIYLFGSQANDTASDTSDVDLAVLLPYDDYKDKELVFFDLKSELDQLIKINVDLVNLRTASVVFHKEVLNNSKTIFCSDENAKLNFEMYAMSFYQKLNEERKEILHNIGVDFG